MTRTHVYQTSINVEEQIAVASIDHKGDEWWINEDGTITHRDRHQAPQVWYPYKKNTDGKWIWMANAGEGVYFDNEERPVFTPTWFEVSDDETLGILKKLEEMKAIEDSKKV
jgi:hypothetical protein